LRCLELFRGLSGGRLLLLTSDKGYHRVEDLAGRREPGFEVHGSLSMGVNYHALASFCARHGGESMVSPHGHSYLDTCGFLLGAPAAVAAPVRAAFTRALGEFTPEDFYLLQSIPGEEHGPLTVEQALAMLRLSRGDPRIFRECFAGLLAGLSAASAPAQQGLREMVAAVWSNYYHIGEPYDLPYDLGVLLYRLGDYPQALQYFERSRALYGTEAKTLYNMGLCRYCLLDLNGALECLDEAIAADASFEPAQGMRTKIQAELVMRH
jgi:tetratricopeptide (TPR) repeat protein